MINGVSIPVFTPYKFHPVDSTTGDGVNFQNVDNTGRLSQDWEGVYPGIFLQPVPRFWNDLSPGLDFQIYLDTSILTFASLKAAIIDLNGVIVQALTTTDFFTYSGTLKQIRVHAASFSGVDDGCYRIKIYEDGGDDIYYSEIIQLADSFDNTYPLEYSNFENDFGMIFLNGSSVTWRGKILIPFRMFKPMTTEERNVYQNDNGDMTTLRSVPRRLYEIESFPVATWYAEKIKLIFSCSALTLNKLSVNTEDSSIDIVSQSDLMEIKGEVQLNEFTDFLQVDALDSTTELITSWADGGATVGAWTQFISSGKNITTGFYEAAGIATANSNSIALVTGAYYLIDVTFAQDLVTAQLSIDGTSYDVVIGRNVILIKAANTGNDTLDLTVGQDSDFSAICSMKKIT